MSIMVQVYRNSGPDCTARGISCDVTHIIVVNVIGPSYLDDNAAYPRAVLVKGHVPGTARLVPAEIEENRPMFGGNFAFSSDSRWRRAVELVTKSPQSGAVPIHDRVE